MARNWRFCMTRELRKNLKWPIFRSNSVWLVNKLTKSIVKDVNSATPILTRQQQVDQDQDQASSLLHLPRQQQSGNLDTPDYARLLLNSQSTVLDNEASAGVAATSTSNVGHSNDCLPSMQLTTSGSQANLTDEDALLMPPPALPQDLAMETDMVTVPPVDELSVDDNAPTPSLFRSRPQFASTPLQSYRPQLPAINEELQRPPTMGRVLEMSERSPPPTPNVAAPTDIPTAAMSPIPQNSPIRRDWASIFRPREFVPDYAGLDVAQPRLKRRRIARRSPERNENEQRSNQEITTGFISELLQTAAQEAETPVGAVVAHQLEPELSPGNQYPNDTPGFQSLNDGHQVDQTGVSSTYGPTTLAKLTQSTRLIEDSVAIVDTPAALPETNELGMPQENVEMPREMDIPMPAAFSMDELPDRPIVTSIQIIYQPSFRSLNDGHQVDQAGISSTYGPTTSTKITQLTPLIEDSVATVADSPPKQQSVQDRLYGENLDDLAYIVEHTEMLRLMVDHQKELSDKQEQTSPIIVDSSTIDPDSETRSNAESQPRYISMPALYTYDPKIVTDMPPLKQRVVHSLIGALIMYPCVELRSAPFIKSRMEAAIAFRVLLELKAANIINLSQDGQTASLREERRGDRGGFNRRRRDGEGDMNNNQDENGEEGEKKAREFYIPPEPTNDETEMFSSGISSGINFSKYDNIPVKVTGENVPPAITSFDNAGLRKIVLDNVKKSGYTVPTPIQKVSIPVIAGKRDLMACAQTGSGKTAAFLLPILTSILDDPSENVEIGKPQAVIVSPTRELAIQIFNEARKFAHSTYLKITLVYGGTSVKHQNEAVAKGCHVLIATPGRLLDFVERTFIMFDDTRFVVLDEADRMLDMGFQDSMRKIMQHPTMRPQHQTLMFSATFPEEIQRMAGEFLKEYVFITIGVVGGACSDVKQDIFEVNKFNKRSKLMEILREGAEGTIVFVETKRGADFLASFFSETEFPTTSIHGDRLQSQREQALRDFKNGSMKVLIATSVAARGLDIKNIKHVINYDMPTNIDDYVHRIGRTGRVGNSGRATSFFDPEHDRQLAGDLIKILKGSGQVVPDFLEEMGGGSSYTGSKFGAVDVRGRAGNAPAANLEEEQDWD
ncbi:hypothetical protein ACLKA6_012226 [Drosophila palustris]